MIRTVVLAGEPEYEAHLSMQAVAEDLERVLGHRVSFCVPDVIPDEPDFPISRFAGLEALSDADLLVVFTRFRRLEDDQMQRIIDYIERGAPVVGLRTSTHAFHYPGSPWAQWNEGFGRDVLGSPWVSHHGHSSTTTVKGLPGVHHPVLDGVDEEFSSPSWLYRVELEPWCVQVLWGDPIAPESPPQPGPVCWVRDDSVRKVVYTSLGHPGDFQIPSFRRLLVNAARWCTDGR
jgi:type 1 glutamine amidotransferase